MMSSNDYWVSLRKDGKWALKRSGSKKATSLHKTQKEAEAKARELAIKSGSEVFIKGKDGKIRDRNTYGDDPFPPKG